MVLASLIVVWVAIIPAAVVLFSLAAARRRWTRASTIVERSGPEPMTCARPLAARPRRARRAAACPGHVPRHHLNR
jgi:hypothetical protein